MVVASLQADLFFKLSFVQCQNNSTSNGNHRRSFSLVALGENLNCQSGVVGAQDNRYSFIKQLVVNEAHLKDVFFRLLAVGVYELGGTQHLLNLDLVFGLDFLLGIC